MRPYLLLTPGPLTTSETVKEAMMSDWCTWDEDYNVGIVEKIRKELVTLATIRPEDYTAVLMQGSGTFCVESTLGTAIRPTDHLLIAANGAYGNRMGVIATYYGIQHHVLKFEETQPVDPKAINTYLNEHPEVTHVSVVHCETTTGVLNPLAAVAEVVKRHGKTFIVDAMSSFGGVPIDMAALGIDFLISSPTSASRACRDSGSSSPAAACSNSARAWPAPCRSTSTTSGTRWRKDTANGASLRPPTSCVPSCRHSTS